MSSPRFIEHLVHDPIAKTLYVVFAERKLSSAELSCVIQSGTPKTRVPDIYVDGVKTKRVVINAVANV
jgi:hypothetical protein